MHQLFPGIVPHMEEPQWLDEQEARAWRGYMRMHPQVQGRLARDLTARSGLSEADYEVLVNLTEAPDGRLRHFALGEALQWDRSRLSHQLTRMAGRGLVTKEACPTDARGSFVVLTDAGRAAIESAAPAHVAAVRRYFIDALDAEQLDALADIAQTVLDHLAAASRDVSSAEEEPR
jgi:DNA-binding MarR family transcriptional regulator